jgi:hypothetical protein
MIRSILNTKPGMLPPQPIDPEKPIKWQTRRVIKPQPDDIQNYTISPPALGFPKGWYGETDDGESRMWTCPYGEIQDRLWVKETWHLCGENNSNGSPHTEVIYRADGDRCGFCGGQVKWKPSIFMPRWASRINPVIINIWAERLLDISGADCVAEGMDGSKRLCSNLNEPCNDVGVSVHEQFFGLWDALNAKRGYGRSANPWVWVIAFMRVGE